MILLDLQFSISFHGELIVADEIDIQHLDVLVFNLLAAKWEEEVKKQNRINLEEKIAALVETKEVGQRTVALPSGVKLTVKRGLTYKADCEAIQECCNAANVQFVPTKSKTTIELDEKGYEWYRANDPQMFGIFSTHVEVKPKKVAITIKDSK